MGGWRPSRRRRRRPWRLILVTLLALLWLASLGVAYRAGTTEQTVRLEQLQQELQLQGGLVRDLSRRAALAEQELAAARAAAAPTADAMAGPTVPPDDDAIGVLTPTIEASLRAGVTVAELQTLIQGLTDRDRCAVEPETRTLLARTPVTRDATNARFAGGRITVAATGVSVLADNGLPEAWFDQGQPVELTIDVDGVTSQASGVLPVRHTVTRDGREYRFEARPHRRRGFIEMVLTVCETA